MHIAGHATGPPVSVALMNLPASASRTAGRPVHGCLSCPWNGSDCQWLPSHPETHQARAWRDAQHTAPRCVMGSMPRARAAIGEPALRWLPSGLVKVDEGGIPDEANRLHAARRVVETCRNPHSACPRNPPRHRHDRHHWCPGCDGMPPKNVDCQASVREGFQSQEDFPNSLGCFLLSWKGGDNVIVTSVAPGRSSCTASVLRRTRQATRWRGRITIS
jgi:hypothetical protein